MTPTERLADRFEEKDETRKKYKCGKCASCYQLEACPVDHLEDPFCPDYLPPEPTRHEWPSIYREALMKLEEPCDAHAQVHRIGRVNAIRDAMLRIHGFSPEDIERIERGLNMECIKLRLQDGAMFFPLDEIRSAKGTTSAGLPAIAFTGRNTGGLQFIKLYREREERDRILQAIAEQTDRTEQREAAERLLADRLRETEEELERMRDQLSKEKAKKKPKPKSKKPQKAKPKPKKDFVIPETSEIVDYIKEKGIDEKLKIPAEVIAESFRSVYEKEEDTGEKDDSGAPICRTVWRKANGSLVENWKSCLQTFKARQLVWDAKQGEKPAKKPFNNQFNQFEQNEYTDEELDEIINSSVS